MRLLLLAALAAGSVACTSAKPAGGTFTIGFPSTAAAVVTTTVQVSAYNAARPDTCQTLVETRRTNGSLPTPVVQTSPVTPCQLLSGGGNLSVSVFGDYAFLAVGQYVPLGQSTPADFLVGCAAQTISATNTNVFIPVELTSYTVALPTTPDGGIAVTCQSLSQHCTGGC